jgi:hypothetical protein
VVKWAGLFVVDDGSADGDDSPDGSHDDDYDRDFEGGDGLSICLSTAAVVGHELLSLFVDHELLN